MQEQKKEHQFSTGLIAGISSIVVLTGGVAAWWAWSSLSGESLPAWVPEQLRTSSDQSSKTPSSEEPKAEIYWLKSTADGVELVAQPINPEKPTDNENVQVFEPSEGNNEVYLLEQAFNELLAGTDNSEYASTIPEDTQLQNVSIRDDGIYINLSEEFIHGGGTTSMQGRLAQVLYTASSIKPEAKVWLDVEGEPLEYLGGEGIYVPQPLTREKFEENYQL